MRRQVLSGIAMATLIVATACGSALANQKSTSFEGTKANKGYVMDEGADGKLMLTLSDDFVVPDTPDPHWQVVDTQGNVYLLQRLGIKEDKVNKTIILPAYIHDVAKVQIWCAWAEALLGEARFDPPLMVMTTATNK